MCALEVLRQQCVGEIEACKHPAKPRGLQSPASGLLLKTILVRVDRATHDEPGGVKRGEYRERDTFGADLLGGRGPEESMPLPYGV